MCERVYLDCHFTIVARLCRTFTGHLSAQPNPIRHSIINICVYAYLLYKQILRPPIFICAGDWFVKKNVPGGGGVRSRKKYFNNILCCYVYCQLINRFNRSVFIYVRTWGWTLIIIRAPLSRSISTVFYPVYFFICLLIFD